MSLYLGKKKIAGNINKGNVADDLSEYIVDFDDSGNTEGVSDLETLLNHTVSGSKIGSLFNLIKTGFKIIKDKFENLKASNVKINDTNRLIDGNETNIQALVDVIANKVINELVSNENLTTQLGNYIAKTQISSSQINDSNKVPSSSLIYGMNNTLNGKAASGHTHDDRYYTESEVVNLINTTTMRYMKDVSSIINDPTLNYCYTGYIEGDIIASIGLPLTNPNWVTIVYLCHPNKDGWATRLAFPYGQTYFFKSSATGTTWGSWIKFTGTAI